MVTFNLQLILLLIMTKLHAVQYMSGMSVSNTSTITVNIYYVNEKNTVIGKGTCC